MQWIFLLVLSSFAERFLNWKKGLLLYRNKKYFVQSVLEKNIERTIYTKVLSLADWLVSRYQETNQVTGKSDPMLSFSRR